jgi:CBS domain-containing membrane protein
VRGLGAWWGIEIDEVCWREKLASVVGAALAIAAVIVVSRDVLDQTGAAMVIGSMGASAVLLFAVPHGALSQPWPVLAGNLLAAVIGVTCARVIPDQAAAAAAAVGLTIGAMHLCRCIHPPGGATALTAVIGGPAVHALGYGFVLRPVLLNVLTIGAVAVAFNSRFSWRRYPASRNRRVVTPTVAAHPVDHGAVVAALRQLDSFIDITEDDLTQLVEILARPPVAPPAPPPHPAD